jgi:hypothetical protein
VIVEPGEIVPENGEVITGRREGCRVGHLGGGETVPRTVPFRATARSLAGADNPRRCSNTARVVEAGRFTVDLEGVDVAGVGDARDQAGDGEIEGDSRRADDLARCGRGHADRRSERGLESAGYALDAVAHRLDVAVQIGREKSGESAWGAGRPCAELGGLPQRIDGGIADRRFPAEDQILDALLAGARDLVCDRVGAGELFGGERLGDAAIDGVDDLPTLAVGRARDRDDQGVGGGSPRDGLWSPPEQGDLAFANARQRRASRCRSSPRARPPCCSCRIASPRIRTAKTLVQPPRSGSRS